LLINQSPARPIDHDHSPPEREIAQPGASNTAFPLLVLMWKHCRQRQQDLEHLGDCSCKKMFRYTCIIAFLPGFKADTVTLSGKAAYSCMGTQNFVAPMFKIQAKELVE
jgi:hypothetical protein